MNKKLKKSLNDVKEEISNMDKDDFKKELKKHKNGDIYNIVIETGIADRTIERLKSKESTNEG